MCSFPVESDQFYRWSDLCARENLFRFTKAPSSSFTAIAPTHKDSPWLAYRAVQTLWQARLQVCRGSGPRSQVLPVDQLSGLATSHGLCAARVLRAGQRIPGQLSTNPRDLRGNLRDQPPTFAASRGALRSRDGRRTFCVPRTVGNGNWCRSSGQYARSLAGRRSQYSDCWGDS